VRKPKKKRRFKSTTENSWEKYGLENPGGSVAPGVGVRRKIFLALPRTTANPCEILLKGTAEGIHFTRGRLIKRVIWEGGLSDLTLFLMATFQKTTLANRVKNEG